jgi:formate--tetrahydrofolate ligase
MRHPVEEAAEGLGLGPDDWEPYGWHFGKITWSGLERARVLGSEPAAGRGRLVLVTAITPTPAGEGKTTTSIGLADALRLRGRRAVVALREPSLGPSLGMKGGGSGGGRSQLMPSDKVNLHFTGDIHAVTTANNLLSAMLDNALHFGTLPDLDPRRVTFRRALDMDDRALRQVIVGLGGRTGGVPREEGFVITAASEVMAILALANGIDDLKRRLGEIVVGFARSGAPVRAADVGAASAMAALLADALRPNLVRTMAGTPALVHAGPFANIAHGTSSILATRFALTHADVVVTEAGFGADLGAEKFFDLVCPVGGFFPDAVVVVATVKALAYHGGADAAKGGADPEALGRGLDNLGRHLGTLARTGVPLVVALNRFPDDDDEALERIRVYCAERHVACAVNTAYGDGPEGAAALADAVVSCLAPAGASGPGARPYYPPGTPTLEALERVARDVYGAEGVVYERGVAATMRRFAQAGYGGLPVCVAKTQYSLTDDPSLRNVPSAPWRLHVRELRLSAGAGFVVALTGEILTMPAFPREPQALAIGVAPTGEVVGIR